MSGPAKRNAIFTFVAGGAIVAATTALALTNAPPRLVRVGAPGIKAINGGGASFVGEVLGDSTVCQAGETLPRGVTGVRVSVWAFFGARVHASIYDGPRLLTQGTHNGAWTGDSVTVPVAPLARTVQNARLCFAIGPNSEPLGLLGPPTPPRAAAQIHLPEGHGRPLLLRGRMAVEYTAPGSGTWWSRIVEVARRIGLGRAFAGTWIALLIAALMAAVAALAVRFTLRELR
jgi:hypothetical protein